MRLAIRLRLGMPETIILLDLICIIRRDCPHLLSGQAIFIEKNQCKLYYACGNYGKGY